MTNRFSEFVQSMRQGATFAQIPHPCVITIASDVLGESIVFCTDDQVVAASLKKLVVYTESEINLMFIHGSPTPEQWRIAHDAKIVLGPGTRITDIAPETTTGKRAPNVGAQAAPAVQRDVVARPHRPRPAPKKKPYFWDD